MLPPPFLPVATDNHVGYLEKDQIRGTDSLEAFEEVLRIGQEQQASTVEPRIRDPLR